MSEKTVTSRQGFLFTRESVDTLRHFLEVLTEEYGEDATMSCKANFHIDGRYNIGWACVTGGYPDDFLSDQLGDIIFYWWAKKSDIEKLHGFCIHIPWEGTSELIPLDETRDR